MIDSSDARFVVIFRARIAAFDDRYAAMAATLRERALSSFGCRAFYAVTEGDQEIALSYWDSEDAIRAWRADADHRIAQTLGRDHWYARYDVEVAEIRRHYSGGAG